MRVYMYLNSPRVGRAGPALRTIRQSYVLKISKIDFDN